MSSAQLSRRGHTLVELVVAMGLFSLVLLATTQGTLWGASESQRVQERERLQTFELAERLKLSKIETVRDLASDSGDELLAQCLSEPCKEECLRQDEWRSMDWGKIKRQMIQDENLNWIDLGTHYTTLREDWEACPLLMKDGVPVAPYFAPQCAVFGKARWKSGGGDTVLIQVDVGNKKYNLNRRLSYRIPIAKDPITGTCRKTAGVSCGNRSVFLTKVDLNKGDFECTHLPTGVSR